MGRFVVGEVVVIPFPFSDLKSSKRRPALVVAKAEKNNLILCQITSKKYASKRALLIRKRDFKTGSLPVKSYARPDELFTAEPILIEKSVGVLADELKSDVLSSIRYLFQG